LVHADREAPPERRAVASSQARIGAQSICAAISSGDQRSSCGAPGRRSTISQRSRAVNFSLSIRLQSAGATTRPSAGSTPWLITRSSAPS